MVYHCSICSGLKNIGKLVADSSSSGYLFLQIRGARRSFIREGGATVISTRLQSIINSLFEFNTVEVNIHCVRERRGWVYLNTDLSEGDLRLGGREIIHC